MHKTQQEPRDRIAHYQSLRRMISDKRAIEALDQMMAEAEEQLQRRDEPAKAERETVTVTSSA